MNKITEKESRYDNLEQMAVAELLYSINAEDHTVPVSVKEVIPQIEKLTDKVIDQLSNGGRLFYIGAGTSGRLGIVDASECPPTFGVDHGLVIGLIAGGDAAIRKAVEYAEDDPAGGYNDLKKHNISPADIVIGIAASGTTPYVVGAIERCRADGIPTGCITCNPNSPLGKAAEFPVEVIVGPEFVTGSTRMKAGTAQKLILNMISTTTMIKLGRVKGNKMVDMQLTNNKLVERGSRMIMKELDIDYLQAQKLLMKFGSVRKAVESKTKRK